MLVRLPDRLNDADWKTEAVKKDLIVDTLYFKHKIEVCYNSTTSLRSRGRVRVGVLRLPLIINSYEWPLTTCSHSTKKNPKTCNIKS